MPSRRPIASRWPARAAACIFLLLMGAPARPHINPPLVLLSERDGMAAALPQAREFVLLPPVNVSVEQKRLLRKQWDWAFDADLLQAYEGRLQGRRVGVVVLLSEITIHGSVRVAVGLGPEGRVAGASVLEVSQEAFPWVRPLLESGALRSYVGQNALGEFELPEDSVSGRHHQRMRRFFSRIVVSMIRWAAALHEIGALRPRR